VCRPGESLHRPGRRRADRRRRPLSRCGYPPPPEQWFGTIRTPILVVHGDDDRIVRIAEGQKVFADAPPPKAMLTVFGRGSQPSIWRQLGHHGDPERLGATLNGPTQLVNTTAVAFLDRYLKEQKGALARLRTVLFDEVSVKLEVVEQ
jgi:pimeloyl-ACP methyl ester carboxylesterase